MEDHGAPPRPYTGMHPLDVYHGDPSIENKRLSSRVSRIHINSSARTRKTKLVEATQIQPVNNTQSLQKDELFVQAPSHSLKPGSSLALDSVSLEFPFLMNKIAVFGGDISAGTGGMFFLTNPVPCATFCGEGFGITSHPD